MCKYNHELCQYDLRGLIVYDGNKRDLEKVNLHYFEAIGDVNIYYKEYKCRICGEIQVVSDYDLKKHWIICPNKCNGYHKGRREGVLILGVNNVGVTKPYLTKFFIDFKDTYTHKAFSFDKVDTICPICGYKKKIRVNALAKDGFCCSVCGDGVSYPEKLMALVLKALGIDFTKQLTYDDGKHFYDFYVASWKAIFETNGNQHYEDVNWGRYGGRTLEDEQATDKYKHDDAINNHGILEENYNIVDCRYSTLKWCRPNIEKALSKYIDVSVLTDEDWKEIDIQAQKSLKVEVCIRWREGKEGGKDLTTTNLANEFKISRAAIRSYLMWGNEVGICDYDGKEERKARDYRRSTFVYLIKPNGEKWFDEPMGRNELVRQSGISRGTIYRYMQNGEPLSYSNSAKYDPKYIGSYVMTVEDYNLKYGSN